ncbi:MAG: hypothetical protein KJ066_14520 [Acidobacteria bacterium]|nr:hypothetical protein [Acidobacteriota bacterium]
MSARDQPRGDGYRHLAVRVIDQALRDIASPGGSATDRASAYNFLRGSAMLRYWCAIAELNPAWLTKRLRLLLARSPRSH